MKVIADSKTMASGPRSTSGVLNRRLRKDILEIKMMTQRENEVPDPIFSYEPEKYYKRERRVHKMSEVKEYYKIKREQKRPWENMYSGMQEGRRRGFYG